MGSHVEAAPCPFTSVSGGFDRLSLSDPLLPFIHLAQSQMFGVPLGLDSEAFVPPRPASFNDHYLYPTLAEDEYDRLMILWYYTQDIQNDKLLLNKFSQMLEIIRSYIGWEIGIVGLVDAEHFVKVTTKNVPVAITPRRESTCSHTINHKPGTVFTINDMSKDWRFLGSPPVRDGGLESYAGTQMRLALPNGKEVAFGTLCVASVDKKAPLTDAQKQSLVRAADIITSEIVTNKRLKRLQEKQSMIESLAMVRIKAQSDCVESDITRELRTRYPQCTPAIVPIQNGRIDLPSGESIHLSAVKDAKWEDTAFIKDTVNSGEFERSIRDRTIRLIIAQIKPNEQAITLSTSKLRVVFDDLDAWFVDQCAQILNASAQASLLREALAAKNTFLRTITHELRTPIHAILSSVQLADEEIKSTLNLNKSSPSDHTAQLRAYLDTIRRSSTELMTTVNNILRLNTFDTDMKSDPSAYDLHCLEKDVLDEVFSNFVEGQWPGLSVRFDLQIPPAHAVVQVDGNLLKELLKCLVYNSITATSTGSIKIVVKLSDGQESIVFDVIDTGMGIAEADHQRVFQAFEKVNVHTSGAGLGLRLALQMASTLGGKLSLISSKLEHGSHFQVQIPYEASKVKEPSERTRRASNRHMPTTYNVLRAPKRNLHLFDHLEHYLMRSDFKKSDMAQGSIIVISQPRPFEDDDSLIVRQLDGSHIILYVCDTAPTQAQRECLLDTYKNHLIFPISGPFFTARLDEIFNDISSACLTHQKDLNLVQTRPEMKSAPNSCSTIASVNVSTPPTTPGTELAMPEFPVPVPAPITPLPVKALLVDDNNVNLSVLQMYCKRRKIPHATAVNGSEAVTQYMQSCSTLASDFSPFTLVLMDLQMPECDGSKATRLIRAHEQQHNLPRSIILILTGQDSVADRRDAFQAGCDDYYVKPVSVKKLDQAVRQFFPASLG